MCIVSLLSDSVCRTIWTSFKPSPLERIRSWGKQVHFKSLHALYDRVVFNKVLNLNPEILLWVCGTRLYDWLKKKLRHLLNRSDARPQLNRHLITCIFLCLASVMCICYDSSLVACVVVLFLWGRREGGLDYFSITEKKLSIFMLRLYGSNKTQKA